MHTYILQPEQREVGKEAGLMLCIRIYSIKGHAPVGRLPLAVRFSTAYKYHPKCYLQLPTCRGMGSSRGWWMSCSHRVCELPCGCWELMGLLQGQQVLLVHISSLALFCSYSAM